MWKGALPGRVSWDLPSAWLTASLSGIVRPDCAGVVMATATALRKQRQMDRRRRTGCGPFESSVRRGGILHGSDEFSKSEGSRATRD